MSSYKHALDAAAKFPAVPFFLAHMGGDTPPLASATQDAIAEGGFRNVWLGLEGMREFFYVARGIEKLGIERFIFGSDYPVGHPRMYLGLVDALRLTDGERALYLGGNLVNVLEGRWKR
jgi:predicted TIM-barrel fold metal-dependent hydrolase